MLRMLVISGFIFLGGISITYERAEANEAQEMLNRVTVQQKTRMNGGNQRNENVRRRSSRGEDCNVNVGQTYVDKRRNGREVNVYTYAGNINVRCD